MSGFESQRERDAFDAWVTREPERDLVDPDDTVVTRLDRAALARGVELSQDELLAAAEVLRSAVDPLEGRRPCIYARNGRRCPSVDLDHDCNIPY